MRRFREYEDCVLLLAAMLAAISEALGADPRYATWALIFGALAKALFSLVPPRHAF